MKICLKCYIGKDFSFFYTDEGKKDGYRNSCKECDKKYREENKEKRKEYWNKYYENNKNKIKEYFGKYYQENKEEILEKTKIYQNNNQDKIRDTYEKYYEKHKIERINYDKKYRNLNKEIIKEKNRIKNLTNKDKRKEYYVSNKDNISLKMKEYYSTNKEIIKDTNRNYKSNNREIYNKNYKNRLDNDMLFKVSEGIRSLIKSAYRNNGYKKDSHTEEILGISYENFKLYIESKFETWMNYENKGLYNGEFNYGWDIDHIIPLSSIDKNLPEDEKLIKLKELNYYTNLQPLCSKINRDVKRNNC